MSDHPSHGAHQRVPGLVSTIIPVYNRPRMLAEAVGSVLMQDYRPVEVIIVDDGSTDETPDVARQLVARYGEEVRLFVKRNCGVGMARETGRLEARGEFVQYLDSDDVLLANKFALQVAALRESVACGVAYGWTRFRYRDGTVNPRPWKGSGEERETMFPTFLESRWWDTPTPLYRAVVCDAAGPWSDLRAEEDWEYDCRVAALGTKLAYVPEYVAEVRDHDQNRLSGGDPLDAESLATRARSHGLILEHALRAAIPVFQSERQNFARQLFFLARRCAAGGLTYQSTVLLKQAVIANHGIGNAAFTIKAYRALSELFGAELIGTLSIRLDTLRGMARVEVADG